MPSEKSLTFTVVASIFVGAVLGVLGILCDQRDQNILSALLFFFCGIFLVNGWFSLKRLNRYYPFDRP